MSAPPPGRRFFQHSFPLPRPRLPRERTPEAGEAGQSLYRKLMQVDFRNDYYPPPFASPDFTVEPAAATAELMQRLGLLFRAGEAGFAILYDEKRTDGLFSFLRREATGEGIWTRLSFVLRLQNPFFLNCTELPLDLDPARENFYFSNRTARRRRKVTILNPRRSADEILPLVPGQLPVEAGPEVKEVEVLDLAGATVLCRPRCFPHELALRMPPDAVPCGSSGLPPWVCRDRVYLDFSALPEGRYTIETIGDGGEVLTTWRVLSSVASPVPFAFVDLLLTPPVAGEPGVYPVRGLRTGRPAIASVEYQLVFRRRATLWRYYIVLPKRTEARGLEIRSLSPPWPRFRGPDPVRLGDGTPAFLFTARKALPLQARPKVRLLLRSDAGVLLAPLPVASNRQVLPLNEPAIPPQPHAFSDIYVYV